jgi:peroxiredoxin
MTNPIRRGTTAPDFELHRTPDQKLALRELRGCPVILLFYPADWSPVCGDELALFNEIWPELQRYGAQVLGISVDGVWCHDAYARELKLRFPLLADFEPKGRVARDYGVYREGEGVCERALFVLDRAANVSWSYVSPIAVNPGAEGVLQALEQLESESRKEKDKKEKERAHEQARAAGQPH